MNNSTANNMTEKSPATAEQIMETFQLMPLIRDVIAAIQSSSDPDTVRKAVRIRTLLRLTALV